MRAVELIHRLNEQGIYPYVEDGKLKTRSDDAVLDPQTIKLIREYKEVLIEFLGADGDMRSVARNAIGPRVDRETPAPLSYAQQRLWFLDQLDHAAGAAYHVPAALRLTGALDRAALQATLDRVVARHENLRTCFVSVDGGPTQVVAPASIGFVLEDQDLSGLDAVERETAVVELSASEARAPFDLSVGPLIRGRLLRLDEHEHVLLVTQHHIVSDGWSTAVLVREVSALYEAFCQGQPDPLPELAIQYADYASWQRQWLQGDALQEQIAFWREHLRGAPGLLELPTDRPRPPVQSYAGSEVALHLPYEISAGLRRMSQRHGTTLFMSVLAAWSALLSRMSGQSRVVVGTPIANRQRPEIESLIGFFANTLALQIDLGDDPTVAQLLARIKATTVSAYTHQDLPFEQVVEALQPERTLSYSPLFQVMLSVSNSPRGGALSLPGLELAALEIVQPTTQFDLALALTDTDEGLFGSLTYATDLFDRATVERIAGCFCTLLSAMVADESQTVSRLPLLTAPQREQVLFDFNAGPDSSNQDTPSECLIHHLFESQVLQRPAAIALLFEDQALSYAELNRRANRVAHRLIGLGVKPDDRVALCVERGLDLVIGVLGILKSGGAYVPLDPAYPADRLAYMLEDSMPRVLLTQTALAASAELPTVLLDDDALAAQPEHNPQVEGLSGSHLAYVIYTSGSTGQPKGVMVEHGHVTRLFAATDALFSFGDSDVWTLFHSFAFDFSVWELWGALLYGGRLVVVPSLVARTPSDFYELLSREGVTVLNQTPSAFRSLIAAQARSESVHRLRTVIFGGEALELHMLSPWLERNDAERTRLVNMYGITEITVHASYRRIDAADVQQSRGSLIGKPLADLQLYVLDGHREPVPIGVTGELYVGGGGVARGYLNRAELTEERFIADPFGEKPGGRLYKTGDLGRWLSDGTLEYLGRNDFQVKIRGYRIELGEIEAKLTSCAGVADAVVIAREDASGDRRLVAYVVAGEGRAPTVSELREALSRDLAEYMIPSAFVTLDALPLTPNGKLDRKALPAPDHDDVEKQSYVAPRNDIEATLIGIWQDVLGLERIGIDDHFFRLGGHSLLATRAVSEIAVRLGRKVAVRAIFEHARVRELAAHVAQQADADYRPIALVPRDGTLPLSYAQQRLWFVDQLDGGSQQYHIRAALRLEGSLDHAAMQRALDTILARHEVLRTRFDSVEGTATLRIDPPAGLVISQFDLSSCDAEEQARRLPELIAAESARRFDFSVDAMLRCALIRIGPTVHVAVLTMHHIASDGWSTTVLVKEFAALYDAFCRGSDDPLPPLPLQYVDFAHWQRESLQGEALEQGLAYWRQRLVGIPRVHGLPLDRPRPMHQGSSAARVNHDIGSPLLSRLRTFADSHDSSLFMLLHSAFALLLGRWSNDTDIVIGSPVAGRVRRELEPLIGFFINSVVLRTDLSADPSFSELLAQTRQTALEAYAHQAIPFDLVVDELKPERSLNHAPLFQISFSFHNLEAVELHLPDLTITDVRSTGGDIARFDIELHISEVDDRLDVCWLYAESLFDAMTIERLADSFGALLEAVIEQPTHPVQALPLLPLRDRENLAQWSQPRHAELPALCAHELFEARVEQSPQSLAAVFDGASLTYAELNAQANRVAHYLIDHGIGPDTLVGLCVERSLDMLVGLLGVLKAGAAYLPLDPTYPEARLAYMLDNAGVEHVLTQSAVLEALPLLGDRTVLPLDEHMRDILLSAYPDSNIAVEVTGVKPSHLAYAIYTSGSTGMPKGVLLEHRGLVNLALNQQALLGLGAHSRVLAFASLSFDGSIFEWLMALASGASLHICHQEDRQSVERLEALLLAQSITHAGIPPALLAQVNPQRDYALQVLIVAGEACEERLAWTWAQRCRVCNSYGPSEATVAATHADIVAGRRITLGRALDNIEVQVLNAQYQQQPVGVAGELFLGGAGLARGYLNRTELDAERFIAHPRSDGERLYRTGDLVRWLADGELQFLGRVDDQVKIRGFRIELGEIETQLLDHDTVHEAVVVARNDAGTPRLFAYVVCPENENELPNEVLLAKDWRRHLQQRLPDYMVPAAFIVLDRMPLTVNGKVDKRRLPEPDYHAQQVYVAPEGEIETRLAAIWQQVLRVEQQVGVHDNFFEIGGDSILSIQVVSRANQAGIGITTKQLFETLTISELARVVSRDVGVDAPQSEVSGAMALLPIHHLFFGCDEHDHHHYNQAVLLETPAEFDASALHSVIEAVYRRHDALRLRFFNEDGRWRAVHVPLDEAMVADSCVVESLPAGARGDALVERCNLWQGAFDLARGPLLRAVYFPPEQILPEHSGGSGRLLLIVHHAVVDGVSWRVLLADVELAYGQYARGVPIELAAKTSSFQQWGEALAAYADSDALQREKGFWLQQCAQRVPPLPVDRVTPSLGTIASTRAVVLSLDAEETRALQQNCHAAYRTQINELLLAGVYLGMREWTGEAGLRVRLEGHGRESLFEQLDVNQTVGYFTSVYPLTLRSASADIGDVIKTIKEQHRAIPHHGIGYGVLRYLSADPEIISAAAGGGEPELEFNYLGQFDQTLNEDTLFKAVDESAGQKTSPRRGRVRQLGLTGRLFDGRLNFVLDYSEAQYDEATMQHLAALLASGLRRVIAHCQQRGVGAYTPSDFPLARVDQRQLEEWQARYPAMTRLYPATPMQAGLLFEGLLDSTAYVVQTFPVLKGELDTVAFRAAWQDVIARHDIFRTAFVGEGEALHQLVLRHAELPWHEEDWRDLSEAEQNQRFEHYRLEDRQRGFDFAVAPLLRIVLFRLGDQRYQLLWTQHHILSDGWSGPLVYRDVIALYQARVEARPAALKPAPVYEHYIAWQQRQDRDAGKAYWRTLLGDVQAPTPLGMDRLPTDGDSGHREQRLHLGVAETRALQTLAQSHRVTPSTLLQWCWGWLLHRYSGESEVVFGATISGRSAEVPGIEDMVGLFINTIPVRLAFDGERSIAEALSALHLEFQRSNEHGYLSLLDIQQQSRLPGGVSLFDSLLVFENLPVDARQQASSMRSTLEIERSASRQYTHYKLTLIALLDEHLQIHCGYRAEHFAKDTIERLLAQLQCVLEQLPAAVASGRRISLLGEPEQRQIADWNATAASFPVDACIHELFEAQTARTPDAIAVADDRRAVSYGELNRRANRLARELVARGVGPDMRVGICTGRSWDTVLGVLAVLKAGGAYLALDPAYPPDRLAYMLEDSGVALVLTSEALAGSLPSLQREGVLAMDPLFTSSPLDAATQPDEANLDKAALGLTPAHLAYVIYTSGSTGRPKGVLLEHAGLVNLAVAQPQGYGVGVGTRVLQFSSISFDAATWDWVRALTYGASLHICSEHVQLSGERLGDYLIEQRIHHALIPPAVLAHLDASRDYALRSLIVGGDACDAHLAWRWAAKCALFNAYGPTECTVVASQSVVSASRPLTIGAPLPNVELHVLDEHGDGLPVGVPGELHIASVGLARGYLNQPGLTEERFVQGTGALAGRRLYRSGDRVRRLASGELEFLGRIDHQVKLRGFRIELGEIESQLMRQPGVSEAVVLALGDGDDKRLVAYIVGAGGDDVVALRRSLEAQLPHYMVPAAFVALDVLPLTANGKIDRRALPQAGRLTQFEHVEPATDTEIRLAAIWRHTLKLDSISVNARFFEVGGHSLLATQVVSAVLLEFGCVLKLKDLFAHQTIAEVAQLIDALKGYSAAQVSQDQARDDETLEEMEW